MDISMRWLNQYLSPSDLTPEEADHILTEAGMPIEEHKPAEYAGGEGDVVLDVEVTSNRGIVSVISGSRARSPRLDTQTSTHARDA